MLTLLLVKAPMDYKRLWVPMNNIPKQKGCRARKDRSKRCP
jgi:hypothetical protein